MRRVSLLALVLALVLAACGGGDNGSDEGGGGGAEATATATSTPEDTGGGSEPDGKALFAGTCGSCHTLADANTSGTFGPNLDDLKPDEARVKAAIESGPGQMPAGLLSGADADAVAAYVSSAAGS